MACDGQQLLAGRVDFALQLQREQKIGELALSVSHPLAVAVLPLQIVETNFAHAMRAAGDVDDPARPRWRAIDRAAGRSTRSARDDWCRIAFRIRPQFDDTESPSRRRCCTARPAPDASNETRRRNRAPKPGSIGQAPSRRPSPPSLTPLSARLRCEPCRDRDRPGSPRLACARTPARLHSRCRCCRRLRRSSCRKGPVCHRRSKAFLSAIAGFPPRQLRESYHMTWEKTPARRAAGVTPAPST